MNEKLKSCLIAGSALGLLSGIPLVGLGNYLCCMWVILGGFLAVFLYKAFSKKSATTGEGALLGLYSGLIGAPIATILSTISALLFQTAVSSFFSAIAAQSGQVMPAASMLGASSILGIAIGLIINLVVFSIFGLLGGIIAAAVLK